MSDFAFLTAPGYPEGGTQPQTSSQQQTGGKWSTFFGKAKRGYTRARRLQRRSQRVRNPQHAFLFCLIMDVLTILFFFSGLIVWFYAAVIAAAAIGLYLVGWPALLYLLKIYPGGYLVYFILSPILGILYKLNVNVPGTVVQAGQGGGGGGGGGSSDKESSWSYGYHRERGEAWARTQSDFVSWFFKKLPTFLLLGGLIFFVMNATSPDLRASTLEKGKIAADKMHITEGFSKVKDYLNLQKALEAATGIGDFEKRPDYLIEGVNGVDVERFNGINVYEGDPFQIQAELDVDAFPNEDSKLVISCQLRDKNDTVQDKLATIGGQPEDQNTITIAKGTKKQKVFAYCNFDKIENVKGAFKDYRAYLVWEYAEIKTQTVLKTFIQQRTLQDQLRMKGIDPLEGIRGSDYIDRDGFAIDNCVKGCGLVDLSMKIGSPMPLNEDGTNNLDVRLVGLSTWDGKLHKLHELGLKLPNGVSFRGNGCFWQGKGGLQNAQIGNNALTLNEGSDIIKKINDRIKQQEEVLIKYTCPLNIEGGEEEMPTPATIYATAYYDYGGEEPALVHVLKREMGIEA